MHKEELLQSLLSHYTWQGVKLAVIRNYMYSTHMYTQDTQDISASRIVIIIDTFVTLSCYITGSHQEETEGQ